jgi:hypothetical protein
MVQEFLDQGGDILIGEAFYPRHFYPGESLGDVRGTVIGFLERDHLSRTEFYLSGSDIAWAVLFREESPQYFPHGAEVLVIGCKERGTLNTLAVVLLPSASGEDATVYWRDDLLTAEHGCPLIEAQ